MIKFLTFNCRSLRKNNHIVYNLCKKYDIIALQETFLPKQESDLLGAVHPSFQYVASSPVDLGKGLLRGRPRGGLAFLIQSLVYIYDLSKRDVCTTWGRRKTGQTCEKIAFLHDVCATERLRTRRNDDLMGLHVRPWTTMLDDVYATWKT